MNLLEVAKQALDALEDVQEMMNTSEWFNDRVTALRKAIEQAEKQEPVAWVHLHEWKSGEFWPDDCFAPIDCTGMTPLYTAPPQREWVGLTDEEMQSMWLTASTATPKNPSWSRHIRFWKAIEAKLKEKNPHGWQSVANPTEWLDDLRGGKDEGKNKDLCDND